VLYAASIENGIVDDDCSAWRPYHRLATPPPFLRCACLWFDLADGTALMRTGRRQTVAVDAQDKGEDLSVVARVRDAILTGELAPGQRLVEAELTERFGATRGTVRQALVHLEGVGLVTRERNRGASVRAITLDEAIEITEARAVLEGLCAAKAATAATRQERDELKALGRTLEEAVGADDIVRYSDLVQDIHRRIREIARQHTVAELLERLRYQSVRHHFRVALLPGRPAVGLREHLDVIDAVTRGTPDEAEAVMRRHLISVIAALRELAERGLVRTPLV
jgi:DNA-binding GntR family transcriptional regulator